MIDLIKQEKTTGEIMECAKQVQKVLGKRNSVYFYREFFKIELEQAGLRVTNVNSIYMYYKNEAIMGSGDCFIVKGILLEVKALERDISEFETSKLKTLLEFSVFSKALIINFWDEDIEKGVKEIEKLHKQLGKFNSILNYKVFPEEGTEEV